MLQTEALTKLNTHTHTHTQAKFSVVVLEYLYSAYLFRKNKHNNRDASVNQSLSMAQRGRDTDNDILYKRYANVSKVGALSSTTTYVWGDLNGNLHLGLKCRSKHIKSFDSHSGFLT